MSKVITNTLLPYKTDVQTIVYNSGTEFARHTVISEKLGIDFYFAHPYSSWERGANENANGLIRHIFLKNRPLNILLNWKSAIYREK